MTDAAQPYVTLNDGRRMPQLGLGVWQVPSAEAAVAVEAALRAGYRAIDTAAIYGNETGVGAGLRAAGVPRSEVFVTTKLWNDSHGRDRTLRAMDDSLARLGLDYVDLYLIHWPVPKSGLLVETWKAMVELVREGKARSVGVSNFRIEDLRQIMEVSGVAPTLNQVELHPRFQQHALRAVQKELGVAVESWSPLGQGQLLGDPVIGAIARKHGKTPAQVIIRWHLDSGLIVIPKSSRPARVRENFAVHDFRLDANDMAEIGRLDSPHGRIGPDPASVR